MAMICQNVTQYMIYTAEPGQDIGQGGIVDNWSPSLETNYIREGLHLET